MNIFSSNNHPYVRSLAVKRIISAITIALSTMIPNTALAAGKTLYKPYAADINKFRHDVQRYEDNGGFNIQSSFRCPNEFVDVRIEGRILAILISPCLADKILKEELHWENYTPSHPYGYRVEFLLNNLAGMWHQVNKQDRYVIEIKLRSASGGSLGSIMQNGKYVPPIESKRYDPGNWIGKQNNQLGNYSN